MSTIFLDIFIINKVICFSEPQQHLLGFLTFFVLYPSPPKNPCKLSSFNNFHYNFLNALKVYIKCVFGIWSREKRVPWRNKIWNCFEFDECQFKSERPSVDQKKKGLPRKIFKELKKKVFDKSFFYYQKFEKGYRIHIFFFLNFKNQYPLFFFSSQVSKEEIPLVFYYLLSFWG